MSTRIVVLEHEQKCPPAWFGTWMTAAGAEVVVVRPYAGETLPAPQEYDGLVVLGGTMGANDEAEHAWLSPAKRLIRDVAASGRPVLGICLGHQLAASALGGEVEVNPNGQTVGLQQVGWTDEAADDPLMAGLAGRDGRAVQFNGDVVTRLPEGSTVLAAMPDGQLQAARFAEQVWGVQWHPEAGRPVVENWADGDVERGTMTRSEADAHLDAIEAAHDELTAAWRPLAEAFVEQVATSRRTRAER